MTDELVAAGLNRAEADAMVQTWWRSYFERPGTRVFWIMPRALTDKILPLKIEPAPADVVRVLVGRSEVLTPRFESDLLVDHADPEKWKLRVGDRYAPAYEARIKALKSLATR